MFSSGTDLSPNVAPKEAIFVHARSRASPVPTTGKQLLLHQ